ncbi:MAG: helix-turn-helix domain-containing protein [Patescibacteria group bacterium]
MNDIVTVEEAAMFLHKHPGTIRRWIESNKLKARHLSAGGHGIYAILRMDLLECMIAGDIKEKEKIKHAPTPKALPDPQTQLPL